MRARLFKKLIIKLKRKNSKVYRNLQLQILLWLTSKSFGVRAKWILFSKNPLEKYMLFSKRAMLNDADLNRVFDISYGFGKRLKSFTGLAESEDLKNLVYLLYQYIGIKMIGELPHEFVIKNCYFSGFYGPKECQKMSAMDAGIIAGIYSGLAPKSGLVFTERLTEGCSVCRAELSEQL